MVINGRYYEEPSRNIREITLAVHRLPLNDPLRPLFEFLLGYISEKGSKEVPHAEIAEINAVTIRIDAALSELGHQEIGDLDDGVSKLIELAKTSQKLRYLSELLSATP